MDVGEVPGTMYGLSDTGWMNKDIFSDWFDFHFLKYAPPARPLLIIMDGHSSHFTPDFINRAAEENIVFHQIAHIELRHWTKALLVH